MMSLTEKLAYIQGLCEGLALDDTTKEGKVLLAVVELLDDLTDTVSQLDSDVDQIFDELDAIDEDLTDLFDEENPLYEITCPKCGEIVCMDEDMLFSPDCACPNCGTSFEIEFDEECDCEECAEEDEE
ncbi:MAG: hypothetical protein J6Q18_00140 [Oscillospiraceae bacterium]|nr:hypothetical protein [Oscillospiraceae bacterium]